MRVTNNYFKSRAEASKANDLTDRDRVETAFKDVQDHDLDTKNCEKLVHEEEEEVEDEEDEEEDYEGSEDNEEDIDGKLQGG